VIPTAVATASSAGGRVVNNSVLFSIAGPSSTMIVAPTTTFAIVSVRPGICPSTQLVLAPMDVQPTMQETPALTATIAVNVCRLQRRDARVRGLIIFDGDSTITVSPVNIQY
jgi:hypothetical protein